MLIIEQDFEQSDCKESQHGMGVFETSGVTPR